MDQNPEKEGAPLGEAPIEQLIAIRRKYSGETGRTHRQRILAALRLGPLTTFEARKFLDVPHPAGRVQELRAEGNVIHTLRTHQRNDADKAHCIARYVLKNVSADVGASLPVDKALNASPAPFQPAIVADTPTGGTVQPEGLYHLSRRLVDG